MPRNPRNPLTGGASFLFHFQYTITGRFVILEFFRSRFVEPTVAKIFRYKLARIIVSPVTLKPILAFKEALAARNQKTGQLFFGRLRPQIATVREVRFFPEIRPLDVVRIGIERDTFTGTFDVESIRWNPKLRLRMIPVDRRAARFVPAKEEMFASFNELYRKTQTAADCNIDDRHARTRATRAVVAENSMYKEVGRITKVWIELPIRVVHDTAPFLQNLQHDVTAEASQRIAVIEFIWRSLRRRIEPVHVAKNFVFNTFRPVIELVQASGDVKHTRQNHHGEVGGIGLKHLGNPDAIDRKRW